MIKALFVHDHPFFLDTDGIVYSGGGLPKEVWLGYLKYVNELNVYARTSSNLKDKKTLSSLDNRVNFTLSNGYKLNILLPINLIKIITTLNKQIKNNDLIILRLPSLQSTIAGLICLLYKKFYIVEQVGNTEEALNTHGSNLAYLISNIFNKFNKYIVYKSCHTIYVTPKALQKTYKTKGNTYFLSDVKIENIYTNTNSFRFSNSNLKIGLIGGFDAKYKGQDILIKAISILSNKITDNIELYLVGKGDSIWIEKFAKELKIDHCIKFIGSLEYGVEIFNFLSSLDIYVQPSLTEGMPRAMLEAMSMGCPILASKVGGIPDIIEEKYLHEPRDFMKLSNQIELLYNNRNELNSISSNNLTLVKPFLKENLDFKKNQIYKTILTDFYEKTS